MAEIVITFTGTGKELNDFSFDLFQTDALGEGSVKEIPGGGRITMLPMMVEKADTIRVIELLLQVVQGTASVLLIAEYFQSKLEKHPDIHTKVNRREVRYKGSEIAKTIEEEIETWEKTERKR